MAKKNKRLQRQGLPLLVLPLCLTLGVLVAVYLLSGLFPFGRKTLVWGDFSSQVLPFLQQFRQMLRGGDGLLRSMANAGGMNFVGVFLYFIASPFSLLAALVPEGSFYEFANLLVLVKLALASCTATLFFANKYAPFRIEKASAGALGAMYALGGFTLLFYQNNVWLDAVYLLPLVALALLYLYHEGRVLPFTLGMTAMMVVQFQLAFAVWLALLVGSGLLVLFFLNKRDGGLYALRLGVGSVLAILLSMSSWLPALLSYGQSARADEFLGDFWGLELRADIYTTLPILLCTAPVLAAVVWLLYQKGWRDKKVRFCGIVFLAMCVPLLVEPVNKMWHGGSYQSFPARYGFITLFVGLVLLAAAVEGVTRIPQPRTVKPAATLAFTASLSLYFGVLLYVLLFHETEASSYVRSLWGNKSSLKWGGITALAGMAVLLLLLYLRHRLLLARSAVSLALCCTVLFGGLYNGMLYIGSPARGSEGSSTMQDMAGKLDEADIRVKTSRMYTEANTVGAMGYDSLGHYSSFTRQDYLTAYKKLGYSGYWMELSGFGGTAFSDYLLNVGGVITRSDVWDPLYDADTAVYSNGVYAMQQQAAGGYGLLVRADAKDIAQMPEGDRFETQNWLYQSLYNGEGDLLHRYEPGRTTGINYTLYGALDKYGVWLLDGSVPGVLEYTIQVDERETLYFDCFRYISNALEEIVNFGLGVSVNGVSLETAYPNTGANGILCLGSFENETVEVRIDVWRSELVRSFGLYGLRQADMDTLAATALAVDVAVTGSKARAEADAAEPSLLVLTLAYDEGYSAYVNGERAALHRVLDGFMAVEVPAGQSTVELRFMPQGLLPGLLFSLLGVLGCLALWLWQRKNAGKVSGEAQVRIAAWMRVALMVGFVLAVFLLYLFPLGVWAERGQIGRVK